MVIGLKVAQKIIEIALFIKSYIRFFFF